MNSHAKISSTWIADESWRPTAPGYFPRFHHVPCGLVLISADILTFGAGQWLFGHDMGLQEVTITQAGGLHTAILHANIYWLLAAGFLILRGAMGDYGARRLFWDGVRGTATGLAIASIPDFIVALAAGPSGELRALSCWIFLVVGIPAGRQCARAMLSAGKIWKIPTAIIGGETGVSDLYPILKRSLALGLQIRWAILTTGDELPENRLTGVVRISLTDHAERIAGTLVAAGCREAIIAPGAIDRSDASRFAHSLRQSGISVTVLPAPHRLPPHSANPNCFFGHDLIVPCRRAQGGATGMTKRLFDIVASACLLVALSPLFLLIAAAIKLQDEGPVTYAHRRVGKNGIPFSCLKFRTMVTDAERMIADWQTSNPELHEQFLQSFKLKDDPRITPIGKWLRRTSLDELPQFWNVFRGQMSLVGPRPVMIQELEQHYGAVANLYLRVRPGLTGMWQISGRNETGYDQRVLLDEWYILNWSFWNDIVILSQTACVVLTGDGAL